MSVILPKDLIDFLAMPFEMEMMCLPCHYPDIASFLDFQAGYRFCGNSATDLIGHQAGDWHPNELYCSLQNTQISQLNENTVVEEYTPLIYGKLILTETGQHKLKVVSFIKQHLKLTGAEALHCIQQLPLEIETGSQRHCQRIQIQLENIGAMTKFLANEN